MDTQSLIEAFQPLIGLFGEHPYVRALVIFLIAVILAKLVAFVLTNILGKIAKRTGNQLDDAITRFLHAPLFWSVVLIGAYTSITVIELSEALQHISRALIASLMILIWSFFLARLLRRVFTSMSNRASEHAFIRPQTLPLFNNIALIIIIALSTYFFFQAWHIDMTAWIASAGIMGIAIGFAAKDTLANLFSGVFILADTPYKIGDYVVLESGNRGKVTNIGLRSTRLLTRDDVELTIPNSIMGNTTIVNESGGPHLKYRIRVRVGVAYGSDIDQVREILQSIGENEPSVCKDPEPRVRFRAFGNSGLDFELLCWADNPEVRGSVLDTLNSTVYKRFKEEGVEIPYSKHDLYIKEMPGSEN